MRRSSASVGAGVVARVDGDLRLPAGRRLARRRADAPGWSESRRISPVSSKCQIPRSVTTTDGPAPEPALLAPDPLRIRRAAEVPGRGPEVDPLDERARRLAHDHEHLAGVDRDLARAAAARQARRRRGVVADDGRVDVPEPVDLGGAQEPDVDQPALQVEAEQLVHAHDRRRAGDDRRVADAQRQPRRPGPEDARLVHQLEVRRHRPLGEVDRDVRQPDARRSRRAGPPARARRPRSSSRTWRTAGPHSRSAGVAFVARP